MWVWINLPYATFGIRVNCQRVVDAAPIGRWMIGKDTAFIRNWITKKGGTWKLLNENEEETP